MKIMLLSETTDAEPYIQSEEWACQEKLDGERMLVEWDGETASYWNRRGMVRDLDGMTKAYSGLAFVIDGELLPDGFVAFDILSLHGEDLTGLPFWARFGKLQKHSPFPVVPTTSMQATKRAFVDAIRAKGGEGVVFKRLAAKYQNGRSPDCVKHKFWISETFKVSKVDPVGSIELMKGDKLCGSVRFDLYNGAPPIGSLVEVRFCKWTENGKLQHPVCLGARTDIDPATV